MSCRRGIDSAWHAHRVLIIRYELLYHRRRQANRVTGAERAPRALANGHFTLAFLNTMCQQRHRSARQAKSGLTDPMPAGAQVLRRASVLSDMRAVFRLFF